MGIVFLASAVIGIVKGDLTNAGLGALAALAFIGSAVMLLKKSRKGNA